MVLKTPKYLPKVVLSFGINQTDAIRTPRLKVTCGSLTESPPGIRSGQVAYGGSLLFVDVQYFHPSPHEHPFWKIEIHHMFGNTREYNPVHGPYEKCCQSVCSYCLSRWPCFAYLNTEIFHHFFVFSPIAYRITFTLDDHQSPKMNVDLFIFQIGHGLKTNKYLTHKINYTVIFLVSSISIFSTRLRTFVHWLFLK